MDLLLDQVQSLFTFASAPVKRVGTGLKPIDNLIGGPAPGEICMVIARSYAGKSVVGQNIIYNNNELPSIFFSMEMPELQALLRLYSMWSNTSSKDNQYALENGELDKLIWNMVLDFPCHVIDDDAGQSLEGMSRKLEMFQSEYRVRPEFVVVDYLELLGGTKAAGEGFAGVESQATSLKDWAKQEEMRVFVLHQTNRQEPKFKPPTENSARFGGYTEADFVLGLWRPHTDPTLDYWDAVGMKNQICFNVLKNRAFFEERDRINMKITPSLRIIE